MEDRNPEPAKSSGYFSRKRERTAENVDRINAVLAQNGVQVALGIVALIGGAFFVYFGFFA